ncbi:hypothetical protein ACQPZF_10355 [Actinosynnema sp. CS-041913]|uniref:hypothetical protein n=1 Tax=Actinosynnema sp. CS-041913 TaxID=3239917 RepID=UPI003D937BEA
MSGTSARVEARRRARLAQARRREALREHEKRVRRWADAFYEHEEFRARHERACAACVAELLGLGESIDGVAALLGVDVGRVRALKALTRLDTSQDPGVPKDVTR